MKYLKKFDTFFKNQNPLPRGYQKLLGVKQKWRKLIFLIPKTNQKPILRYSGVAFKPFRL